TTPWNQSRHFGPVDARFEPHPAGPATTHRHRAVWYAEVTPQAAVAEVFQRTRTVRLDPSNHLTSAYLSRDVRLLDVTGDPGHGSWATRAGASMALSTGRHDYSSAWARAICDAFPGLDGLIYLGAMEGGLALALFVPPEDAMPTAPATSRAIGDPALTSRLAGICDRIGYRIVV
ncbi:MAG: RES domain-containing protein, partial [Trebonia sp.]